jgi:predicted DNA binding CopG/RHH family protein
MSKQSIHASDEAWEDRSLGSDENFVKVANDEQEASVAEASGTQMISIRIQKSLIEDFKMIASLNGNIGYQTLMKQIMQRFVDCEKKQILNELVREKLKSQQKLTESPVKQKTQPEKARKIA